jgi:cytochrome d ubiquinol oxidase subunit II
VPVGNAAGGLISSWTGPVSILIGIVAVSNCAYLAAVYLAADAARNGEPELERAFRARALIAGVVAGAVALAGLIVLRSASHHLFERLLHSSALVALIVSGAAGIATLSLVWTRRLHAARFSAALAVAAVIAGWGIASFPHLLPGLTVHQAAAPHDTLVALVVAVLAGGTLLFPSLALLFSLTLGGRLRSGSGSASGDGDGHGDGDGDGRTVSGDSARGAVDFRGSLAARASVALLIAGAGLLNLADADWAHALGVVSLFSFMLVAFVAIFDRVMADEA